MRTSEWSQEVDLQLLAVLSAGFGSFELLSFLKIQVIQLKLYSSFWGERICIFLSCGGFGMDNLCDGFRGAETGNFVWRIYFLLHCVNFLQSERRKWLAKSLFFFFLFPFITTTSNNHGENMQTVSIQCKAI